MTEHSAMPKPVNGQVCWFEIPVTDLERSKTFYETVLGTTMRPDDTGPNPMVAFTRMDDPVASGHLYPGKPAAPGRGGSGLLKVIVIGMAVLLLLVLALALR